MKIETGQVYYGAEVLELKFFENLVQGPCSGPSKNDLLQKMRFFKSKFCVMKIEY